MSQYDKTLMGEGSAAWTKLYGAGICDDARFAQIVFDTFETMRPGYSAQEKEIHRALFGVKWADEAFRTIDVEESFAAALMCTPAVRSMSADVRVPWKAFMVRIPRGLLTAEIHGRHDDYDRLLCFTHNASGKEQAVVHVVDSKSLATAIMFSRDMESLFFTEGDEGDAMVFDSDGAGTDSVKQTERAVELARRLVVGVLYTMQHTNNFRETVHPTKRSHVGRQGPPEHRVTVVGKALSVNCADAVRSYVTGSRRGLASFQTVVMGHRKRQPFGVGGTARKIIWVQPYWRGPEDAPILARPYLVGAKQDATVPFHKVAEVIQ